MVGYSLKNCRANLSLHKTSTKLLAELITFINRCFSNIGRVFGHKNILSMGHGCFVSIIIKVTLHVR